MTAHPLPIIHDGDHGADDFVATLLFAAWPEAFECLGVTTVFGNTTARQAARNAGAALAMAGRPDLAVRSGCRAPLMSPEEGDGRIFGADGLGGVAIPYPAQQDFSENAVRWMAETIKAASRPVTLCLTGPMTNAASLLRDHPGVVGNIAGIVAMGGCLGPLGPQRKQGNMTPFAEFNIYMDPHAADAVLTSGLPVTLLPLDLTNQFVFTPERQQRLLDRLNHETGRLLTAIMRSGERYSMPGFGLAGAALHDQTVPLYLRQPDLFGTREAFLRIETAKGERYGQMIEDSHGRAATLVETVIDSDRLFELMLDGLCRLPFTVNR